MQRFNNDWMNRCDGDQVAVGACGSGRRADCEGRLNNNDK